MTKKKNTESIVKDIKRKTRRKFSAEVKIRIVLEGLKGEKSASGIRRREGITPALYYRWSKGFLETGKKCLMGDTMREANTSEVKELRGENSELKETVAELLLQKWVLKKVPMA